MLVREGGAAVEVLAAGLADYGVPGRARRAAGAGAHPARGRACSPSPAPRSRAAAPPTCSRGCGPRASSPIPTPPTRSMRGSGAREAADRVRRPAAVGGRTLAELDALAEPPRARAPVALLDALLAEAEAIWTAPHRRRAAVLGPEEAADARAAAELRAAARELRGAGRGRPGAARRRRRGGAGGARRGRRCARTPRPGACSSPTAPAIRARRFRAVFVCGLQDGEFPRRPVARAVPRRRRARLARARPAGSCCAATRTCWGRSATSSTPASSRPEEVLFLSFRSSDEEGDPAQASPFLDDVRALFTDELWRERGTRLLAEVTWPPAQRRRRRTSCAAPGRRAERVPEPAALGAPADRRRARARSPRAAPEPARGLETFAACGVRWLVESLLRPERAEPDPGADAPRLARPRGARGDAARAAGAHRLGAAGPGHARRRAGGAASARSARSGRAAGASWRARAGRPALRALEEDLARYLRHEAEAGAGMEPRVARVELRARGRQPRRARAQRLGQLAVTGRVDRIDVDGSGLAVVRDYKGKTRPRRRALGPGRAAAGRAVRARRARAARARARGRALPADRQGRPAPARLRPRRARRAATSTATSSTPRRSTPRCSRRARRALGAARALRAGRIRAVPVALLAQRLRLPGHLPRRRGDRGGRAVIRAPRFTAEQRAAVAGPQRLRAAGRQRRLGQDRRDGRALRRGGAARRACPSARSSR